MSQYFTICVSVSTKETDATKSEKCEKVVYSKLYTILLFIDLKTQRSENKGCEPFVCDIPLLFTRNTFEKNFTYIY